MGNINLYKSSSASGPWSLVQENIQSPVTFDEEASGLIYYGVRDEGNGSSIGPSDYKVISEPVYVFGSTDKVNSITFDDATDLNGLIIKVTSTCGDASNHKVQVQINVKDTGWKDFAQVEIGSDIQATYTPTEADGLTEGSQIKFRAYIFNTTNVNYRTNNSEEYVYILEYSEDMIIYIDIPIPSSTNFTKRHFALRKELGKHSSNITKFSYKVSLDGDDILSSDSLENLYLPCLTSDFTLTTLITQSKDVVYNKTFNGAKMLVASIKIMGVYVNKQINIKYTDINTEKEITGDVNFIYASLDVRDAGSGYAYFNTNSVPSSNGYYVIILNSENIFVGMDAGIAYSLLYIGQIITKDIYSSISNFTDSSDSAVGNTFGDIASFDNASTRATSTNYVSDQIDFNSPGVYTAKHVAVIKSSLFSTASKIQLSAISGN